MKRPKLRLVAVGLVALVASYITMIGGPPRPVIPFAYAASITATATATTTATQTPTATPSPLIVGAGVPSVYTGPAGNQIGIGMGSWGRTFINTTCKGSEAYRTYQTGDHCLSLDTLHWNSFNPVVGLMLDSEFPCSGKITGSGSISLANCPAATHCLCTDTTAANAVKCALPSGGNVAVTATGSDVIYYDCRM